MFFAINNDSYPVKNNLLCYNIHKEFINKYVLLSSHDLL